MRTKVQDFWLIFKIRYHTCASALWKQILYLHSTEIHIEFYRERESEYWQELGNFLIRRHFWDSLWWGLRALQGAIRISQRASQGNHVKVTCKSWRQFVSPRQINISLSWWNLENYAPKWSSFLQSAKSTWTLRAATNNEKKEWFFDISKEP